MTDSHDPWSARVDFAKILDDIAYMLGEPDPGNPQVRLAVSQERLAAAIGFPRGTIRNWLDGSEPRHFDGEQLLAHWCRLTGKARTFAPVDRFVYSAHKVTAGPVKKRDGGVAALVEQWGRAIA